MLKYKWMCVAVFCCAMFAACEPTGVDTSASDKNLITFGGRKNAYMSELSTINATMWGYYVDGDETTWVFGSENGSTLSGVDSYVYEKTENNEIKWVIDIASPTKYWTTGTYDFFSLYSEEGDIPAMTRKNDLPTFTYDIESQHEIRLAKALGVDGGESLDYTNSNASNRTEPVDFTYNHILSRIKFRGSSSVDGMPIKMTKFIVTATKTAEYAIAADVTCTPATSTVQLPYADGVNVVEKEDGFKYKDETDVLKDGENIVTSLRYTELPYAAALDKGKVLKKIENGAETVEDYGWLVFPTSADNSADKISIIVEYVDNQGIITQKTATLPSTTKLEMGKSYIFQFSIQPAGPIIFADEVIINDWDEEIPAGDVQF